MIALDMKMPDSCYKCKLAHDDIYCSVTHKSILDQRIDFRKERLPECPLWEFLQPPRPKTEIIQDENGNLAIKNNRPT